MLWRALVTLSLRQVAGVLAEQAHPTSQNESSSCESQTHHFLHSPRSFTFHFVQDLAWVHCDGILLVQDQLLVTLCISE